VVAERLIVTPRGRFWRAVAVTGIVGVTLNAPGSGTAHETVRPTVTAECVVAVQPRALSICNVIFVQFV